MMKGGQEIKFTRNIAPEGFGAICDGLGRDFENLDHHAKFKEMISQLDLSGRIWRKKIVFKGRNIEQKVVMIEMLEEWLKMYLRRVDNVLIKKISAEVKNSSVLRTQIVETVFNFTGIELPKQLMNSLNVGSNFVVHTCMSESQARLKMEAELLSYLEKYRKYVERKERIFEEKLSPWLEKAIETSNDDEVHKDFYSSICVCLAVDLGIGKRDNSARSYEFTKLDEKGIVIVEADKGMGVCLLNIKDLVKADAEMVKELGGKKCTETVEEVKEIITEKIKLLEESLEENGKKFMRTFYGGIMENVREAQVPFLKIRPKLHKLTKQELEMKDASRLKYRPVIDASRGPLTIPAKSLMDYIRDLMQRTEKSFFGEEEVPMIKNGHAMVKVIEDVGENKDEGMTTFAVADLSSAYTFIYLKNLLIAMQFLGKKVGIPQWKNELFQKIAKLVLENSFIQTTEGIFSMGTCLPMGLCCSGECLDLVLLMSELVLMGKVEAEHVPGFISQYGDYKLERKQNKMPSFMSYKRYRDDTCSSLKIKKGDTPEEAIKALGEAFIPSLDINIEVTIYVAKFLDLIFFKRFSGTGMETMVKRKGIFPIGFCHAESNMNNAILTSIIGGEILRHRRLTKNRKLIEANDEALIVELKSRRYRKEFSENLVKRRIQKIGEEYDQHFNRRKPRENPEGLVYGAKTIFNQEWNTHYKLHKILRHSLPINVR